MYTADLLAHAHGHMRSLRFLPSPYNMHATCTLEGAAVDLSHTCDQLHSPQRSSYCGTDDGLAV